MIQDNLAVIIPVYNAEKYVSSTLDSVLKQTLRPSLIVAVNDGSTDDTLTVLDTIAKQNPAIQVISQENQGVSKARNAGLAALPPNIEFVSFLDADDIWLPDFLEVTYSKLKCDSEAVACHTLGKFIDSDGNDIRLGECEAMCRVRPTLHGSSVGPSDILEPTTLSTLIISGAIVAPSAVLFRREVIAKINGFDPKFQICADWNLYLRAAKYGRFLFVESALLGYRQHGGNMSTNQERQKEEQRRVVQAALSSIEYSDEQRLLLRRSFKAGQRYLFKQKLILSVGALKRLKVRQCVQQLAYGIKHLIRFISGTP